MLPFLSKGTGRELRPYQAPCVGSRTLGIQPRPVFGHAIV